MNAIKSLISSLFIFLLVTGYSQSNSHRFAIKSGYIKYELTGSTVGTKEFWWDEYGDKTCELEQSTSTTKVMGMTDVQQKHELSIINRETAYSVDYLKNKAYKTATNYESGKAIANSMTEEQQKKMADDLIKGFGGERLGNEKVLNYSCEVISLMGSKTWIYMGLGLKTEISVMGINNSEIAIVFQPNASVPPSKFEQPSGYTFEDYSNVEMNPWAALSGAYEEASEDDVPQSATKYPYDDFTNKVNRLNYNGYKKFMVNSMEGMHTAIFMQGMSNSLTIVATSKKGADNKEINDAEAIVRNGKTYYYGEEEDEDGENSSYIVLDVPKYDTFIVIAAAPTLSQTELFKIADQLNF